MDELQLGPDLTRCTARAHPHQTCISSQPQLTYVSQAITGVVEALFHTLALVLKLNTEQGALSAKRPSEAIDSDILAARVDHRTLRSSQRKCRGDDLARCSILLSWKVVWQLWSVEHKCCSSSPFCYSPLPSISSAYPSLSLSESSSVPHWLAGRGCVVSAIRSRINSLFIAFRI